MEITERAEKMRKVAVRLFALVHGVEEHEVESGLVMRSGKPYVKLKTGSEEVYSRPIPRQGRGAKGDPVAVAWQALASRSGSIALRRVVSEITVLTEAVNKGVTGIDSGDVFRLANHARKLHEADGKRVRNVETEAFWNSLPQEK